MPDIHHLPYALSPSRVLHSPPRGRRVAAFGALVSPAPPKGVVSRRMRGRGWSDEATSAPLHPRDCWFVCSGEDATQLPCSSCPPLCHLACRCPRKWCRPLCSARAAASLSCRQQRYCEPSNSSDAAAADAHHLTAEGRGRRWKRRCDRGRMSDAEQALRRRSAEESSGADLCAPPPPTLSTSCRGSRDRNCRSGCQRSVRAGRIAGGRPWWLSGTCAYSAAADRAAFVAASCALSCEWGWESLRWRMSAVRRLKVKGWGACSVAGRRRWWPTRRDADTSRRPRRCSGERGTADAQ